MRGKVAKMLRKQHGTEAVYKSRIRTVSVAELDMDGNVKRDLLGVPQFVKAEFHQMYMDPGCPRAMYQKAKLAHRVER